MSSLSLTGAGPELAAFSPASISGLGFWLKADAITGLSDGAAVVTWLDASGQGSNVTQATGAKQPTYHTARVNGLPAVTFDGARVLESGATPTGVYGGSMTLLAVAAAAAGSAALSLPMLVSMNAGEADLRLNAGLAELAVTPASASDFAGDISGAGAQQISGLVPVGSPYTCFRNGASATASGANAGTPLQGVIRIGGRATANFWSGDICEVIVYNSALSTTDRQSVEAYLKAKWATP